ncbi:MAG: DUF2975 domain-containing protein [Bacteroidales bacterium]|jgi:hypothetical protein|nr:DUF2975 domain-containing protein [Bacteroidales bacterium]
MKTTQVLKFADLVFKIVIGFIITLLTAFIFIFIHSSIHPEFYDKVVVTGENYSMISYLSSIPDSPETYTEWKESGNKYYYLNRLSVKSKLLTLFRIMIPFLICLLLLKYLVKFFRSVKNLSTFFIKSSAYFTKIAYCFTVLLVFDLLNSILGSEISMIWLDGEYWTHHYNITLGRFILDICLILIAFLTSFVFKEGEQLRTENELTI